MERKKIILKFSALAFALVLCCCMILPAATPADAFTSGGFPYFSVPYDFTISWMASASTPTAFSHAFPKFYGFSTETVTYKDSAAISTVITGGINQSATTPILDSQMSVNNPVYGVSLFHQGLLFIAKDDGLPYMSLCSLDADLVVQVAVGGYWIIETPIGNVLEPFTFVGSYETDAEQFVVVSDVLLGHDMAYDAIVHTVTVNAVAKDYASGFSMDVFRFSCDLWNSEAVAANRSLIEKYVTFTYQGHIIDPDTPVPEPSEPHVCPTVPGETVYVGVGELGPGIAAIGDSLFDIHITETFSVGDFVVIIVGLCVFALCLKLFAGGK